MLLGCAGKSPRPDAVDDCPAAVAAEKERATKEGRPPVPIVQKGRLLTAVFDPENRPAITFAMAEEAKRASLEMEAKISVNAEGRVDSVEVVKSSGVRSFDDAVVAKMKTWVHQPSMLNCRAVPYSYPMSWKHRYAR
ncbi:MAG TPA: TonB family protein [Polyangia bacterium]|nr:TonB family protein [Polyangia bacterium]